VVTLRLLSFSSVRQKPKLSFGCGSLQARLNVRGCGTLQIAHNKALDDNTREQGMELAAILATTKSKQLIKLKLIKPLVESLCLLTTEPCDGEVDEDFQAPIYQYAAQVRTPHPHTGQPP
jgi:hypothetical protein